MSEIFKMSMEDSNFTEEYGHTVTITGNPQLVTNDSMTGTNSVYLNESSYFTILNNDLVFGVDDDFTIQMIVKCNTTISDYASIFGVSPDSCSFMICDIINKKYPEFYINRTRIFSYQEQSLIDDTWHHIAISKGNHIFRMFFDGKKVSEVTFDSGSMDLRKFGIGIDLGYPKNSKYVGYIDEFSIDNTCLFDKDFDVSSLIYKLKLFIKDGDIYKTYDEDTDSLIDVDDIASAFDNNKHIRDLNCIVPHLSELSNNWKLISNKDFNLNVNGLKTNNSMLATLEPLNMRAYDVIHNITGDYVIENNGAIKFIFSFDKGTTWKTYDVNNSEWNDVNVDIPIKLYENFTDEDKTNWNDATNTILSDGISVQNLGNVNFQSVKTNKLMFAVAFNRSTYSDTCTLKDLKINYDGLETYIQLACGSDLNKYEATISITGDSVEVKTASNQNKILVTMTTNI